MTEVIIVTEPVQEIVVSTTNEQIIVAPDPTTKLIEATTGLQGVPGPANSLSVGSVSASSPGGSPSITITGSAPSQTLNFVLPRGDIGPPPNIGIGTVTTTIPGSLATVQVNGTSPNYTLDFSLPTGQTVEWLSGSEPPSPVAGKLYDWYIVTTGTDGLGDIYQKTDTSAWTLKGNIRGVAGTGNVDTVNGISGPDVIITATDITSGVFSIARIPTGTTSSTVSLGNHNHDAIYVGLLSDQTIGGNKTFSNEIIAPSFSGSGANLTSINASNIGSGTVPIARIPVGTTGTTVAAGNHAHNASQIVAGTLADARLSANVVMTFGDQTLDDIKTFNSAPIVPDASFAISKIINLQTALDDKASTSTVVLLSSDQTIGGIKTFSSAPSVPDASFAISKVNGLQSALDAKINTSAINQSGGVQGFIVAGTTSQYWRGDKSWQTLDKSAVGLGNVANTDTTNASNISTGTLDQARLKPNTQRFIFTTAGTTRPTGTTYVEWVGPVEPTNAVDGDSWISTA